MEPIQSVSAPYLLYNYVYVFLSRVAENLDENIELNCQNSIS